MKKKESRLFLQDDDTPKDKHQSDKRWSTLVKEILGSDKPKKRATKSKPRKTH